MAFNILPVVAIGAGAVFLLGKKGGKSAAKPGDAQSAEDEVAGAIDDAIAEEAQAGGGSTITPSGPVRDGGTPTFAEPVVVDTGMAGKGAYRVVQLSEVPPVFQAEIGESMGNYIVVGQFETEESAIAAAKQAGIDRYGAIGR